MNPAEKKLSENEDFIDLVENTAKIKDEEAVPRDRIIEALKKIEREEEPVLRYPSGLPSPKSVFFLAQKLNSERPTQ